MKNKVIPSSELIINADGSVFHLHLHPQQLTDRIILVGDPGRVDMVAANFDTRDFEVSSREFHTIGGTDNVPVARHRSRQYRHRGDRA